MRPRKRIVLLDINEDRRRELAYALAIGGEFAVEQIAHPTEPMSWRADLLIACWPFEIAPTEVLHRALNCSFLVIAKELTQEAAAGIHCNQFLLGTTSNTVILEAAHTLSQRKRGPKRGSHRNQKPLAQAGD